MTVKELIEQLSDVNPNAEVRLAIQPRYPFEYEIQDEVVETEDEAETSLNEFLNDMEE